MSSTDYDALISSGDIARAFLSLQPGAAVFDVGPASARTFCTGLDLSFTTPADADVAVTAGAFQDSQGLDQLRPALRTMLDRQLLLVCANPDLVIQIGGKRVQCSGALAQAYAEMGGPVRFTGKPYAEIFDRAMSVAAGLRGASGSARQDIGYRRLYEYRCRGRPSATDLNSLFVMSGIHAQELGEPEFMHAGALDQLFRRAGFTPTAVTWRLDW